MQMNQQQSSAIKNVGIFLIGLILGGLVDQYGGRVVSQIKLLSQAPMREEAEEEEE